jgi:hypothetical protein
MIGPSLLRHFLPNRSADWDASGFEFVKAVDIDSKVVGCDSLPMKGIDPTDLAEEVPGSLGVELILSERCCTTQ